MDHLVEFITQQASCAHWYIFVAILLAGMNIPISIDILVIMAALLSAQIIPENTPILFLSVFLGSTLSAWIAFWMGRLLGPKLSTWPYFSKLLSPKRLTTIKTFYEKYGLLTLIIGRFIPFGIRNGLFMTTGISRTSFVQFIYRDLIACALWSSTTFYLFYRLSQNYQALKEHVKLCNIAIFIAFGVTVIGIIWYKKRSDV